MDQPDKSKSPNETEIDEALDESFPASDPPSWTPGTAGEPPENPDASTLDEGKTEQNPVDVEAIIEYLDGLNESELGHDGNKQIAMISQRFGAPEEAVRMAIAEWEAGKGQAPGN